MSKKQELALLARVAEGLERLAPRPAKAPDFAKAESYVWNGPVAGLVAVARVNRVPLETGQA